MNKLQANTVETLSICTYEVLSNAYLCLGNWRNNRSKDRGVSRGMPSHDYGGKRGEKRYATKATRGTERHRSTLFVSAHKLN